MHTDADARLAALAAEGIEPRESDSQFPFNSHAKHHARVRDAAAATAFATPGVYWPNPLPARWTVPLSAAKYEFMIFVREITDYVDQTFPALRDNVNDLPATLASVTKALGKDSVPAALKNGNAFTLWSPCGLQMTQNARAVPADGNVSRADGGCKRGAGVAMMCSVMLLPAAPCCNTLFRAAMLLCATICFCMALTLL